MPIITLRDLYIAELHDLVDAETQLLQELPRLGAASTSTALRDAFEQRLQRGRIHLERLELLLRQLGAAGERSPCEAMRGLIAETRRRVADGERGDVLDAALIGAAQRMYHYGVAAYGCARTYARTLGDQQAERLLQQTLDEEGDADSRLSELAERGINERAREDAPLDADRARARLRYLPARGLRDFRYADFRVRNRDGEDLGAVDGVVVDGRSGHPLYFVVDSGGWFLGRQFLVPVDMLKPDDAAHTLDTDLTREAIRTYPPFDPEGFAGAHAHDDAGDAKYRPPTWLMTGVWMTEASGFASVPPRAQSDFGSDAGGDARQPHEEEPAPETELMIARGEPDERAREARQQTDDVRSRER